MKKVVAEMVFFMPLYMVAPKVAGYMMLGIYFRYVYKLILFRFWDYELEKCSKADPYAPGYLYR